MGGWRCSYRNCTVRSDGKTHMFHYPVFDKVRCHQWLVNAGRMDFFNLKVSQLKNRVICQHHFPEQQFMNFKRDKLTFNAVPSLSGPFCDVGENQNENLEETTNSLSIILDDIENNEHMTLKDKKANYSVKYADFLTSNELSDIDMSAFVPKHNVFNTMEKSETEIPLSKNDNSMAHEILEILGRDDKVTVFSRNKKLNSSVDMIVNHNKIKPDNTNNCKAQPVLVVPPYKTNLNQKQNQIEENILEIELPPGFINSNSLLTYNTKNNISQMSDTSDEKVNLSLTAKPMNRAAKVQILSEKRISEPLTFTGHLEPVSPSAVLPILQKKPKSVSFEGSTEIILNNQEFLIEIDSKSVKQGQNDVASKQITKKHIVKKCQSNHQDNQVNSPSSSLLKNKITPERIAAIKEKRKFNMKLRDIIESFLDKLDEQDKEIKETTIQNTDSRYKHFSKESKSSVEAEKNTIHTLEARIKKMEDALLSKIDSNSQQISELKNMVVENNRNNKCHASPNFEDKETHKKRLYREISQYLSPIANNLIYEELFINKYVEDVPQASTAKRRKRR